MSLATHVLLLYTLLISSFSAQAFIVEKCVPKFQAVSKFALQYRHKFKFQEYSEIKH